MSISPDNHAFLRMVTVLKVQNMPEVSKEVHFSTKVANRLWINENLAILRGAIYVMRV